MDINRFLVTRLKYIGPLLPLYFILSCGSSTDNLSVQTKFDRPLKLSDAINSAGLDAAPAISSDHSQLYFHSNRSGGKGSLDIWMSSRILAKGAWGPAVNLGPNINTEFDDRAPTVANNGLLLLFASNRPYSVGGNDIFMSTRRSTKEPWGTPVSIGSNINTKYNESGPSLVADGLSLFFHSDRPGGAGATDLYVTTRLSLEDAWGKPVNLGQTLNSAVYDVAPGVSADGLTLYFHSTRAGGLGTYNILVSTRSATNAAWSAPKVMGSPVNSISVQTGPSISSDGHVLYFASSRTGSDYRDIWQVSR